MEIDKRKTQRNVQSLDIGYGITLIDVPSEINYKATRWEADERVDALKKNTFPDQFMLASDIVHVHEKGALTNPLDCTLFSEEESITVNVVLPSVNDINLKYFQYKAAVRFQMQWEFLDIEILGDNKGIFRKNKIESMCIFIQSIKESIMLSEKETQYVNSKDEQIQVKFPQNSVTKSQQIDFKVYPVNVNNINWTKDVNEMGVAKISECLFGSHVEFQVPVLVQLPLKLVGTWEVDDTDMDYIVFKVNDDWSLDFLDTKPEIKDGIASFTVNSFSGVAVVAATRKHPDVLENVSRSIQAAYMFTKTCKILFFVRKQTSLSSMMIILECVASEKMEEIIINRKAIYDFDIVKEWTSRDIDMIPDRTVIKVDVRGKFSMPKEAKIKSPAIYCNPFGRENFNRFQVELSQRVGGSLFGILSFRNTKHVIDEIFYDPSSRTKVPNKSKSGYRIMRNEREVKTSRNQHSKGINKL
ncbi:uncharacterized protein LOC134719789 [Mytilus trossulus]|uniref:uncharacterized protein LOC134719789 n=1 Tax=Mytilus trossulus TaxID=6551 RepID=UPI003006F583